MYRFCFRFHERGRAFSTNEVRSFQVGPGGLFFTGDGRGEIKVWKWDTQTPWEAERAYNQRPQDKMLLCNFCCNHRPQVEKLPLSILHVNSEIDQCSYILHEQLLKILYARMAWDSDLGENNQQGWEAELLPRKIMKRWGWSFGMLTTYMLYYTL